MTFELAFDAIGTKWQITAQTLQPTKAQLQITHLIKDRIEVFDKNYSRFRSDSLVSRMSQQPGTYDLPADGYTMLRLYEQLYQATEGKVTPLIGQAMSDAGYDVNYSLQPVKMIQPPAWENVLSYTSESITLKAPAILDFGAAGKDT